MSSKISAILKRHRLVIGLVCIGLAVVSVVTLAYRFWPRPEGPGQEIPIERISSVDLPGSLNMTVEEQPISLHLSEGLPASSLPETGVITSSLTIEGQPLNPQEVAAILTRLPALELEPADQQDFRIAQQPIPPPRSGEMTQQVFPPQEGPPQAEKPPSGPLKVLRYAPEGEIPLAPVISVTFNQPMVALGTLEDLTASEVPLRIEPELPGTWRWLGTQTLSFTYDSNLVDRLPKATLYRLTVPAGTRSATGGVLETAVEWTFTTPSPVVVATYPGEISQPREPLFFVAFDQRIDPQAVLKTIRLQAGGTRYPLRMASQEEIQADATVKRMVKDTPQGRWLAFRPANPLPNDTRFQVQIGPETPSAEGPLVSSQAYNFSFQTYPPLTIKEHGCAWGSRDCPPNSPLFIRFSNPLDPNAYQAEMLRIEPEIPGVVVDIFGETLQIRGATRGRTTYTVTVSQDIQDSFGQKLGQEARLTFQIGRSDPNLVGPRQALVTLDPSSKQPALTVYSMNYSSLDVQIYAVQPADWPAFQKYLQKYQNNQKATPPGRLVVDKSLSVEGPPDTLSEVNVDVQAALKKGDDGSPVGHAVVIVRPPQRLLSDKYQRYWQTVQTWVQVTQIGVDAFVDHSEMVVWATALKDGKPLGEIQISSYPANKIFTTNPEGNARFNLPGKITYLTASRGADQALLVRSTSYWDDSGWQPYPIKDTLAWYVFDDRQMYRPGEEVHIKGWLRRVGGKQNGDVGMAGSIVQAVNYQIHDPQGNAIGSGKAKVNAMGGFDLVYTIPQAVNLGYAGVSLTAEGRLGDLDGWQHIHNFQIQEFRRPEFEVQVRNGTPGPYFAGESAILAVEAKYYAGDPLPNAETTWQVSSTPGSYSPPGWPDFTFGTWQPWWRMFEVRSLWGPQVESGASNIQTFSGLTDASGTHYLKIDLESIGKPEPLSVLAQATVIDVNRQAWTGTTSLLVHPASLYVGLRSPLYFVERGTPLRVDLIVTDLDGKAIIDRPIQAQAARLEWKYRNGSWLEQEVDIQTCQVGSSEVPVSCKFKTELGGTYRITATIIDEKGRQNQSQVTRWVSGGKLPLSRKVEQETVTLIPDKETYQPGDTARLLVQAPFSPAEGLLTVSRSGILYTQNFHMEASTFTLEIPIRETHLPNLNIQVDLVGSAPRVNPSGEVIPGAPSRPAFASGQLSLPVPPLARTLSLQVIPEANELEPGGETTLNLLLKDASGEPVPGAELAVFVVDEAILALTNYRLADPISIFYQKRSSYLSSIYGRSSIILANPEELVEIGNVVVETVEVEKMAEAPRMAAAPTMMMRDAAAPAPSEAKSGMDGGQAAQPEPIRMRSDFNPLAVFMPAVHTDAQGQAQVDVKLPDNLTRYRVMVVAVDENNQFGVGEANLTARLPLMVRPSAPRFLNFGDRFELPVVLQNQTSEEMEVEVAVRVVNLDLTGADGLRVKVPAHDRVEVRFPTAAMMAGIARIQVGAQADSGAADAATLSLPVYTPATTEAFATYGVVDEGSITQPVSSPSGVFSQFGGLEIQTSSTAVQALTDAVLYLVAYPFECSEQLASRILAVAGLRDVLTAFEAEGLPSPKEMEAAVVRDIQRLKGMQNEDGGFPYWRKGFESIPFNSIHVAHALQRAEEKGYKVPGEMKSRALEYLRQIESHYPEWYSLQTRQTLSAYALYVRTRLGDRDPAKARKLLKDAGLEKLSLDAVGWLWQVLLDDPNSTNELSVILRHVENWAVETAGAANFTTQYDDQNYLLLGSNRRTDAILLEGLMASNPQHDLIPKLVNGLLAHRTKGHWGSTQENVFVLLSLDRYFNVYEAQTPDFVARIWLGEAYAGEHTFRGRTTERFETKVPMAYLTDPALGGGQTQDLVLSKEGPGRLYYRLGLCYAPDDLDLQPLDMGFVVERRYEAADNPADVRRDEDGIWHIKAGSRVRVRLTMVARNRRYHVALVDPLPAGLEIVNPALAVSGSTPQDPNPAETSYGWWWWRTWYEHQNMRDERAEAFTPLLWEGVYEYTYITRASTPGTFVVPPAKAEEMYSPEVFGRSASDQVSIE
jgi:hypothetical protein